MSGTRGKGAIALALILGGFLLADLYRAEFGAPQTQPIQVTTSSREGSFVQTQPGATTPYGGTQAQLGTEPGVATPTYGQPTGYSPSPSAP